VVDYGHMELCHYKTILYRQEDGSWVAEIPASRTLLDEVARTREALVSIDATGEAGFEAAKSLRLLALRAVACVPLAGAVVDIWQCDASGVYSGVMDPQFDTTGRKYLRGLQTTRMAERLLEKLGKCLEEAHLPSELFQRLRQELMWSALSPK